MTEGIELPARIKPYHETSEPGADIELCSETATISQGETIVKGQLRIVQHWTPMRTTWEFTGNKLSGLQKDCGARVLSETFNCELEVWGVDERRVWGFIQGQHETGEDHVHAVYFHLPSFPSGFGADVSRRDDGDRASLLRVVLESCGWKVAIESHKDHSRLNRDAREMRDVVLSGVGVLCRDDGAAFATHQAVELLDGVRVFLSFAFGEWCPPVLLVGTDVNGNKTWERWANYDVRTGWRPRGWLGPFQREAMSKVFPGFCELWHQEKWREPLQLCVTWLIEVLRPSCTIEGAIALGQIPLEMLAWLLFADDKDEKARKQFRARSADQKITALLKKCGISIDVPSELTALSQLSQTTKFKTGPQLVTKVRNTIIHPNEENRLRLESWEKAHSVKVSDIRWEAQQLFKWYITLVLLRQIGYSGDYANRLTPLRLDKGVEPVPWAVPWGDSPEMPTA